MRELKTMIKLAVVALLSMSLSGCIVGTAVGIATDIVVGTVDIATDVVGTAVDVVVPGKKKSD
jgi:predicted small secreted protein